MIKFNHDALTLGEALNISKEKIELIYKQVKQVIIQWKNSDKKKFSYLIENFISIPLLQGENEIIFAVFLLGLAASEATTRSVICTDPNCPTLFCREKKFEQQKKDVN